MKTPKPPDPYATAAAQQGAEIGASTAGSIVGNPNTYTPYGSQKYTLAGYEKVPDAQGKMITVPRYNMTQTLSRDQQMLLGQNTATQWNLGQAGLQQSAKLGDYLNKGVDTSKLQAWNAGPNAPQLATGFGDAGQTQRQIAGGGNIQTGLQDQNVRQDQGPTDRAAIERAMMQNYTMDTAGQNAAQDAQMAARGMAPGSAQYGSMDQTRQNARGRAVNEAYLASGQESRAAQDAYNQAAAQKFGQGAQMGQFANAAQLQQFQQNAAQGAFANSAQAQAYQQLMERAGFGNASLAQQYGLEGQLADRQNAMRNQQLTEALTMRNQPLNEIMALLGGSQVTLPQFQNYQSQGVNSANIADLIGQNYQQASANANNFNSGLFSMVGAVGGGLAKSDRRLKEDIEPLGIFLAGAPLYTFAYKAEPMVTRIGVMADEVKLIHPDAVVKIDGYDHVDYDLLNARNEEHKNGRL